MTESQWARRVPVVKCTKCIGGSLARHDYNEHITCPTCNGAGTILKKQFLNSSEITNLITKTLSDANRSKHGDLCTK